MEALQYAELPCSEVWGGNGQIERGLRLPGLDGAVFSQPCLSGQGGDVYYVTACSAGILSRVYLADVVGHGEQVVHMSNWLYDTLRHRINSHKTDAIFSEVNHHVLQRGLKAFSTAACITYNAKDGELTYCYAGHPPILRYSAAEKRWETLRAEPKGDGLRNVAFGVTEYAVYDVGRVQLDPGDVIVMYSDGLTEAPSAERVLFGEERLLECLESGPDRDCSEMIADLLSSIRSHAGKDSLDHDDVTVLTFRATPLLTGPVLKIFLKNRLRRWQLHRNPVPASEPA
jgi:sigma-B regulation protein RsbU (phosphoserine phosphatase)